MQSVLITIDVVSSNLDQGEVYNIIRSSLSVTCGRSVIFSGSSGFPSNKTDRHDIAEILLKVALNTIKNKQQFLNVNKEYINASISIGYFL